MAADEPKPTSPKPDPRQECVPPTSLYEQVMNESDEMTKSRLSTIDIKSCELSARLRDLGEKRCSLQRAVGILDAEMALVDLCIEGRCNPGKLPAMSYTGWYQQLIYESANQTADRRSAIIREREELQDMLSKLSREKVRLDMEFHGNESERRAIEFYAKAINM